MIKFGSALDSVLKRGIAHDGAANVKPDIQTVAESIPSVTTADKIKSKRREQATRTLLSDANKTGKAARDERYKAANAEMLREKARVRMAEKRAKK